MNSISTASKSRLILAMVALFLSSMCTMGDLVVSPVVANVYEEFADAPTFLINLGITGPALLGLPFGLITGALCDRFDKKWIMVFGFFVFTITSVFGIMYVNVYYFVTMRLFSSGVSWGVTNTAALSILAEMFSDENEHAKYVGWYNAVMSLLGALLASLAGHLALGGWTHAYSAYWLAVPVLFMLIVFLPNFPGHKQKESAEQVKEVYGASTSSASAMGRALFAGDMEGEQHPLWWKRVALLAVQVFMVAILYFVILYMVGLYVADTGVGDEAFVGSLTSVMTIATAVGSVVFGAVYKRLRNAVYLPALLILGMVFFVLALKPGALVVVVTLGIAGFVWPFYFCYFYTRCTEIVPDGRKGVSTSIVAAADGLAMTACSFLLTGSMAITGGGCASVYPIFGCMMLTVAAASAAFWFAVVRKEQQKEE